MVRQSSPAKGHRTGHYATNALSGSNWNSYKAQGIGGKNERGDSLRHALAVRHIPLCCPDEAEPVSLRGHVWAYPACSITGWRALPQRRRRRCSGRSSRL